MRKYHRLTRVERYQIEAYLKSGLSLRRAALALKRAPSSVSREVRKGRNSFDQRYSPKGAHELALRRRTLKRPRGRRIQGKLRVYIEEKLRADWSPEQIAGRIKMGSKGKAACVSFLSIYRYVYEDALYRNGDLYRHLRTSRKRRKKQQKMGLNSYTLHQLKTLNTASISQRPAIVEKRKRFGDFERDLIRGVENRHFVLSVVDRASRKTYLADLPRKTAEATHEATVHLLRDAPIHTITNDNGSEFFEHEKTAQELNAKVYFAHPFSSWERGTNENMNGLIRQYLPKNYNFEDVTEAKLKWIETRLNRRPRKCLGYKTPLEVEAKLKKRLGVALAV